MKDKARFTAVCAGGHRSVMRYLLPSPEGANSTAVDAEALSRRQVSWSGRESMERCPVSMVQRQASGAGRLGRVEEAKMPNVCSEMRRTCEQVERSEGRVLKEEMTSRRREPGRERSKGGDVKERERSRRCCC